MTPEQLKSIRPRKDDFYSHRLYNWIKWLSEKHFDRTRCGIKTPDILKPDSILERLQVRRAIGKKHPNKGAFYILLPFGDRLLGGSIGSIRRAYRNETYSLDLDDFGPVIKTFWPNYVRKGVCFLNPEHRWIDGPTPWENSPDGKHRKCRWCGLEQKLHSKTVKKVETWWENV